MPSSHASTHLPVTSLTQEVRLATTMTGMMDAQRSYALASKAITIQDQMMQIANQIAK